MPRLWSETVEAHRRAVVDATLDATAKLLTDHGLLAVTMSQIAEQAGIGRATLYKYFPDAEAVLLAWHEREISGHLAHLADVRDRATGSGERLEAVLQAYAFVSYQRHDGDLAAVLHRGEHLLRAQQQVHNLVRDLLIEGAAAGELRADMAPDELATYCLHALTAAGSLPSRAAVHRLVALTMTGLRAGSS